jgi:hypothetical protein
MKVLLVIDAFYSGVEIDLPSSYRTLRSPSIDLARNKLVVRAALIAWACDAPANSHVMKLLLQMLTAAVFTANILAYASIVRHFEYFLFSI